jgi:tetratricopeptide (TPR) repeat protein
MACIDADTASELVTGKLGERARSEVEEHIDGCAACRRLVSALAAAARPADAGPARVGRYLLEERLGAGGMGVVHAARDPDLDRRVAVKIIGTRGDPDALRARLLREAQTMARLSHPNLVTVFDVGVHDGELYVAMELVDGVTLRAWLAERRRPWRAVLRVLADAGRGLAAAHAAGVVHRDFKPENVLVRRDGRVLVSDFGLARAEGPDADAALEASAVVGTPAYMAPEQHRGGRVDARSDQFAFCVALFEALDGARPFAGATAAAVADNVLAGRVRDGALPRHLRRPLRRGLAVDPDARYPSMAKLIADLGRDPWRHLKRGALAAGVVGAVVLARGTASSRCDASLAGVWDDARRAQLAATFAASGKRYAGDTLRAAATELDRYADRWLAARRDACADDARAACLEDRRQELGALVDALASIDAAHVDGAVAAAGGLTAVEVCADARHVAVAEPFDPAERKAVAALRARLAAAHARRVTGAPRAVVDDAAALVAEARALGFRPLLAEALELQALVAYDLHDPKRATELLDEVTWTAEASHDDELAARAWMQTASSLATQKVDAAEAEKALRRASALVERLGRTPALLARLSSVTGQIRYTQGRYAEALEAFQRAAELSARVYGPLAFETLKDRGQGTGPTLLALGRQADAVRELGAVAADAERVLGPEHPFLAPVLRNLGQAEIGTGQLDDALVHLGRALALTREALGPGSSRELVILQAIGAVHLERDENREALPYFRDALALARAAGDEPAVERATVNLGAVEVELGDYAAAEPLLRESVATHEKRLGPSHPALAVPLANLADLLRRTGRAREALPLVERALAIESAAYDAGSVELARTRTVLAATLLALGRASDALPPARQALAALEQARGADAAGVAYARDVVAQIEKALAARRK